ncbi:MAG: DUF3396 domain-containing protein [Polyangiaceae bacterium]|nr:DUF3396 domain-containing protein [Polyangiaceae bacterium]
MNLPPNMEPPKPLEIQAGGPVLYSVLGASFHLELLEPADEARLEAVNELVWDWIGSYLRWQFMSFGDVTEPIERATFDYIPALTQRLEEPEVGGDEAWKAFTSQLGRKLLTDYEVSFHGGDEAIDASPFTYEFWAELPDDDRVGDRSRAFSTLRVTVPDSWPVADFQEKVLAIADKLRLRWGVAGYSYSYWIPGYTDEAFAKIVAHARRFVGYDAPFYARNMEALHDHLRSVGWLTFLGEDFAARLRTEGRALESSPLVEVAKAGSALVLRAGNEPARGDINRLNIPPGYAAADAMVRPLRLAEAGDLVFLGPWTERAVTDWLRRFEQLTS